MNALGIDVSPFFAWLLRATLQGSLLVCLILLIKLFLRNRLPARWHYVLWLVLLVRLSLPWAPQSRLSVYNLLQRPQWTRPARTVTRDVRVVTSESGKQGAPDASHMKSQQTSPEDGAREPSRAGEPPPPAAPASVPAESAPIQDREAHLRLANLWVVLPSLWLIGAVVLAGYVLIRNVGLWRAVKCERPVTDQQILDGLEDGKMQMGVQTIVGLVVTDRIKSPALFGFVRPRILLPEGLLEALSLDELQYVFLHELAHLKRRDIYLGWLVSLLQVLHWFNPLIWLAFRRMRADQEMACDALALSRMTLGEPPAYGRTIVNLLERFSQPQYVPSVAGILEDPTHIERRMTMIAKFKENSYQWSPLAIVLIMILGCISLSNAKRTTAATQDAQPAPPISARRVWAGPLVFGLLGEPSPDGRYLSYVDWESGDLAIYEIATGKKRRLTNKGSWNESNESCLESRWSPDGMRIAYAWETESGSVDLRIIRLDGSDPRILYRPDEQTRWIELCAWFPDGRYVLAHRTGKDGTDQIVQISTADGSPRALKTVGKDCLGHVVFSPDGQYIAYDIRQGADEHSSNRDIRLVSTDGTHEIPLVAHPADDAVLGWAPDGKHILFASDRDGSQGVWLVTVSKGTPLGAPKLVRSGGFAPLGFTRDGSFYYGVSRMGSYVYVATRDSKTGKILEAPEKATLRYEGRAIVSAYSPDGKYLAYICELHSMVRRSHDPTILCIRSLESGRERQFPVDLLLYQSLEPRWSPDGRTLLIGARDLSNREGLFRIDVGSGDIEPCVMSEGENEFDGYDWAHDGNSVFCSYTNGQIVLRNLDTGKTREICPASPTRTRTKISVSPDGTRLAIMIRQPKDETRYIKVIPAAGGEMRELLKFEREDPIAGSVTWTADGKNILFAARAREHNDWELCQIPAEGGPIQKLGPDGTWLGWMNCLSAHPDGRHIAFRSSGPKRGLGEVWVMENFLPGAPAPVAKPEPSISLRRVKTGPMSDFSSPPSPDGRYLCDLGAPNAEGYRPLAVRDLVTGEVRPLTEASRAFPWSPVISPESKHVAYVHQSWFPPKSELQLIKMDGTGHRVLYRLEHDERFHIRAWTPDGKEVLGAFKKGSESLQLVAFSIEDGSMQVIYTFDTYWPMWQSPLHKVAISPDGRCIAYDRPPEKGSWNAEIYILDIEHQRAECVVQHPAYDKLLGWTPDGNHIFFTSDRRQGLPGGFTATNTRDAYLLPVAGGKTQGPPVLIKSDVPDKLRPKGFTSSGTYHYTVEFKSIETAVAKLDLQTGKLLTKPQAVGQTGAGQIPAWSPDGRHLAYGIHQPDQSQIIRIQDIATGGERELDPNLPHFSWLRWSPDGKSFLVSNFAKNSPRAIYRINADTGERLTMVQSESLDTLPGEPQLSPDGSTLYYVLHHSDSKKASLITRDIESGFEEELFALDGTRAMRALTFALSPDGRHLALATQVRGSSGVGADRRISIMPATGGEPRELWKTEERATRPIIAWTPDGQSLLFTKHIPGKGTELWLVPAGGGEARKLCSAQEMMCQGMMYGAVFSALDMHPDGQRIAFDCFEYRHEVWAMENFLPEPQLAKPAYQPDFKKIWIPTKPGNGVLSPDGEKLAFISEGSVWVVPVHGKVSPDIAGEPVRLTEPMGAWDVASFLAWSADGKWIAFNVSDEREDAMYVVPSSGGAPRRVPIEPRLRNSVYNYRLSLSPDGKVVAFCSRHIRESQAESPEEPGLPPSVRGFSIYTVPVAGGEVKRLTDSASGEPAFSPDGKRIAYVKYHSSEEGELCGSLWVVPAVGGSPIQVSDPDPRGRVGGPVWSPDGRMIAFTSKAISEEAPSERREMCIVLVSETGKALASPTKIGLPLATNDMLAGWTPDNKIGVFLHNPDPWAIHTVPASGGHAVQVTTSGWATHPQWSPDGKRIYFRWGGGAIASVPSDGGKLSIIRIQRDPPIGLPYPGSGNAVSPDGKQIVFAGGGRIYTVAVGGGEPTEITQGRYPCWSPDGKSIAFIRTHQRPVKRESGWNIYIVSSKGGDVRQLTSDADDVRRTHIDWSPDGKSIAYFARDKTIRIIPSQGGEPRVVATAEELQNHDELAWSPDGTKLVYSSKGRIWVVSPDGGESEEIRTGLDVEAGHVSWSPDGRKLAFTAIAGGEEELYLVEDFLPEVVAAARE